MKAEHTVILYGGSLFIAALAATLTDQPHVNLVCVPDAGAGNSQHLAALDPVALICEAGVPDRAAARVIQRLLGQIPDILVIEMDLTQSTCTLITREQRAVKRATDLVEVILDERRLRLQHATILASIQRLLEQAHRHENGDRVMDP